jgi:glucose/arabinose dehydrogenase
MRPVRRSAARRPVRATLAAPLLLAILAGCGGGGGGSSSPAPGISGNQPPAFTSATTATVAENSTGLVYTAIASDPEGQPLTFAVAGGADAARFTFNASTRELRFVTPPDFDAPADANRDNVYEISLSASDGSLTTTLALRVTVTDVPGAFRVRRVASGLAAPIFVAGIPDGSGRVAVVERGGRIRVLDPATGTIATTDLLNVSTQIVTDGEKGLLAMAFSPAFATDRSFFVHMNNTSSDTEIRRYRMQTGSSTVADPATADVILLIDQPDNFSNHKGGMLAFDSGGRLLVGMGDGGGGGDPLNSGQTATTLLGKILRIDPTSDAFPNDPNRDYAIPSGNAFPGGVNGAPEVLALGLRNPFRGSVDPANGDIYIGDVGQGAIEEIDRIQTGAAGPINFGWNRREGSQPYNGGADSPAFTLPVTEYAHGSGTRQGNSVTGGVVYRGPAENLQGQYLFADFISNNIWSVPVSRLAAGQVLSSAEFIIRNQDFTPDAGTINSIVAFGTDQTGNVYIVDIGGEVFRIEAAP